MSHHKDPNDVKPAELVEREAKDRETIDTDDESRMRSMPNHDAGQWTPEDRPEELIDRLPAEYQIDRPA